MAMSRFASSDESAIEHFKDASTSIRTKKSTEVWVRVFSSWAEARETSNLKVGLPREKERKTINKKMNLETKIIWRQV